MTGGLDINKAIGLGAEEPPQLEGELHFVFLAAQNDALDQAVPPCLACTHTVVGLLAAGQG